MNHTTIESIVKEFDDQFVPIDWLVASAKEHRSDDRGIDAGVAKYHADRIKMWLRTSLTTFEAKIREEEREMILAALPVEPKQYDPEQSGLWAALRSVRNLITNNQSKV